MLRHGKAALKAGELSMNRRITELKPCPFCGGRAFVHHPDYGYFVMCDRCKTSSNNFMSETEAVKRWNNRAKL